MYGEFEGWSLSFSILALDGHVWLTSQQALFTYGKRILVPIIEEAGCTPEKV
jgi:hypothetical protein